MKKFIVAILSFLYLATSTGATVQLHYCMDKLVGWDINAELSHKCSKCGMEKSSPNKKGCCKDEQKQVKLQNDQKLTEASINLMLLSSQAAPAGFNAFASEPLLSITHKFPVSHAPPRKGVVETYLMNCNFRI